MTKTKAIVAALFSAALLAISFVCATPHAKAAGMPTEEFKAKTPGIPASTIQTVSAFDLNDAKVMGGGEKTEDAIAGATSILSPDGAFRLVQGKRMFVEYVNKNEIKDLSGRYQTLPGRITLKWDNAAIDRLTGKSLDVYLTISNLNVKSLVTNRKSINNTRLAFLCNWLPSFEHSFSVDLHAPGKTSPTDSYKATGRSTLSTMSLGNLNSYANYQVNFVSKDEGVHSGKYNMVITDIDQPGAKGANGKFTQDYNRTDRAQEHVKLLSPADTLHVTKDTDLQVSGREAWSKKPADGNDTKAWALVSLKSGSIIELGTYHSCGISLFSQLDPLFSKIIITKKGAGLAPGHTFTKGQKIEFTYKVENIGTQEVTDIAVKDSKGVRVTCPKAILKPGESMTCTGTGMVK